MAHELGHLYCGHFGARDPELWAARPGLSHPLEELEAESVARILFKRPSREPIAIPAFWNAKQHRWFEPHVAPINLLVQEITRTVGSDVPYVDPDCGGVGARVLLLLEAPACAAAHGSGMLSADNDDGTAANVWAAYQHSGLPRHWGMHWNAVPWHIGVPGKIRAATRQDVHDGRDWLFRLVDLMPDLRVGLTLGNRARDAVAPVMGELDAGARWMCCWGGVPLPVGGERGPTDT